ncbi:MAG: hypothetical protein FWE80_04945 [Oscillospiraceae bacterium]|nr:hypothetical protein [Oscillospiraceae bacterium]
MFKRFLAFSLAVICVCCVAGCTDTVELSSAVVTTAAGTTATTTAAEEPPEPTDPYGNEIHSKSKADKTPFPLIAMLESDDIYLYGAWNYGVLLKHNGKDTYFDWDWYTPRGIMPEMIYHDFDGNGEKELAIITYTGSGTFISIMDLHMLEITSIPEHKETYGKPEYVDHVLYGDKRDGWYKPKIDGVLSNDKKAVTITFNGESYTAKNKWNDEEYFGRFTGIGHGLIVEFSINNDRLYVQVGLTLEYDNGATPAYIGKIQAEVIYKDGKFSFINEALEIDPDFL